MRLVLPIVLAACPAIADPARIVDAAADRAGDDWRVSVTLEHGDTGWDDYADGWRVETEGGTVLGRRDLVHPHVNEQPFTRSTTLPIPDDMARVYIRARTLNDGWGTDRLALELP